MPKPSLIKEDARLESEIIETLLAGLKEWRPDLGYPASHSDMQGCVRGMMRMYHVERRPLAAPLRLECNICEGRGEFVTQVTPHHIEKKDCTECGGKGFKKGY
jgi:hypothetical protein